MPDEQRRNAERITLKEPITGNIGDMEVRIVEISLIGGRIEHLGRLSMNSTVTVQFSWRGQTVRLKTKIARTEMRAIGGKMGYSSGVDFAKSPEEAPPELQRIMASFIEPSVVPFPEPPPRPAPPPPPPPRPATPPPPRLTPDTPAPFLTAIDDEVEEIEAAAELSLYVECAWEEEGWIKTRTDDPKQPLQGFTMLAPDSDEEIDDYCRTFEMADPETQRMIRLSFELAIAHHRRK